MTIQLRPFFNVMSGYAIQMSKDEAAVYIPHFLKVWRWEFHRLIIRDMDPDPDDWVTPARELNPYPGHFPDK